MSISKSTAKYLLMFLGVLIFLAGYFLVYMDFSNKTDALTAETKTLQDRFDLLSGYEGGLQKYKDAIDQDKTEIGETLGKYTSAERPEDFIMLATELENNIGLTVTSMSFTDPVQVYSITGIGELKDYSAPSAPLELTSCMLSSTIGTTMSYSQMKQALDYIGRQKDVTKLNSLNINYDSTTGLITGSFAVDKYYITGRDIEDHQLNIPYTNIGKDVLMGS
jgi:hypothetical protein